jgi:hypothetical protein
MLYLTNMSISDPDYNRFLTRYGFYNFAYFDPELRIVTLLSITVTSLSSLIAVGNTAQFIAIGHYDDGTTKDLTNTVTWASSNTAIATIDITGIVTGVAVGTSIITATLGTIVGTLPTTLGSVSGYASITIVLGQHTHITPPIIMNTPLGHLKFRPSFMYDIPQVVAGPDPHTGHINYVNGQTVIIPPKPLDALQPVLEIRADIPAPRFQWGQEGIPIKDTAYSIKPVVESSTSSDSTAGIWTRGKYFSKKIKF